MLPHPSADLLGKNSSRTIYINPNFKGIAQLQQIDHEKSRASPQPSSANSSSSTLSRPVAHINPLFLLKNAQAMQMPNIQPIPAVPTTMHINPNFLIKPPMAAPQLAKPIECKIISKSCTKLVRGTPAVINSIQKPPPSSTPTLPITASAPIVSLSKRKLIRATASNLSQQPAIIYKLNAAKLANTTSSHAALDKYKLDRRKTLHLLTSSAADFMPSRFAKRRRRNSFVARFALRRNNHASAIITKSKTDSRPKLYTIATSTHRKLRLLNINGVLYKSTKNKLQRKDFDASSCTTSVKLPTKTNSFSLCNSHNSRSAPIAKPNRTVFVRGTKFVMDSNGFKLTRVPAASISSTLSIQRRIDIGGHTYVATSKSQNVYVRTSQHLAVAHLNNAKQRSLQLLSRKLVKSNLPCAIYNRLGKCAAHERGKCNKVHNKLQVVICPKFLRGDCHNDKCLLSHLVSLSKMPVCRYFLQGICTRSNCPYLHKKLSSKADICEDFLKGYCQLADQCKNRHEFLCPAFERTGKCNSSNCIYCKTLKKRTQQLQQQQQVKSQQLKRNNVLLSKQAELEQQSEAASEMPSLRYFDEAAEEVTEEQEHVCERATTDEDEQQEEQADEHVQQRPRRPKLGVLPAFIPL